MVPVSFGQSDRKYLKISRHPKHVWSASPSFHNKNEGEDRMRVAMSTKIDYIFLSTFKN